MRASDFIGRVAYDRDGKRLGRIADLMASTGPDGRLRITHALVTKRGLGRLFGYDESTAHGPQAVARFKRVAHHRGTRLVPWDELRRD